jgi:hypothetical protein
VSKYILYCRTFEYVSAWQFRCPPVIACRYVALVQRYLVLLVLELELVVLPAEVSLWQ